MSVNQSINQREQKNVEGRNSHDVYMCLVVLMFYFNTYSSSISIIYVYCIFVDPVRFEPNPEPGFGPF